jgi:acetolactate synthase-1/2/3 large subunit
MIRVADYVAQSLVEHGITDVFLVTGGNAMHLNDAIGRCKDLSYLCCHHEQACAMAAESYYRLLNRLAAVNVTSGPGATNAITGVFGAWVDSLGMVVLSGQPKWETLVPSTGLTLRQLGDQEADIIRMVQPVTKYAVMVTDPQSIRYHLERAIHLAQSGRPGPTWIDIPMNVQGAMIDPQTLPAYDPSEDALAFETPDVRATAREILERIHRAKRPVILAGAGVWRSGVYNQFLQVVDRLGIPVTTAWNAHDLIWNEHPLYVGRPGSVGDRAGNFAVQNADLLLVLGCRLNIRQVSYNYRSFARAAYTIIVDIDASELKKPTVRADLPVHADLRELLPALLEEPFPDSPQEHAWWLHWCKERQRRYPSVLPEYWERRGNVNPYCFVHALFRALPEGETIVTGDGTACVVTFQAATIKRGQRLYTNSGCAAMGYDLPAAIGACIGSQRKRVICLAGDGSILMNVQELQTIAGLKLPIKIFVLNNQGYHSIKQTQRAFFPDNIVGCDPESGVTFPSFERFALAYDIPFHRIHEHDELQQRIEETLTGEGPQLCEVMLDPEQPYTPKLSSRRLPDGHMVSSPLEDMAPFLPREELRENMLIPLAE